MDGVLFRFRLAAAVLAAAAAAGCQSGTIKTETMPAPAPPVFEELGDRPLTEVATPASYLVLRCGYATRDGLRHLNVRAGIDDPAARADLARVLAALEEARRRGDPVKAPAMPPPARTFELAVGERWIADLDLEDRGEPGPVAVTGRVNGREHRLEVEAPALLRDLRRLSLAALQASMTRPRRPLAWNHEALAGFLGSFADPQAEAALKRELLAALAALPDPAPLAEALAARPSAFDPEEVRRLGRGDVVAVRVLELASAAWRGRREALKEILTLSLEYHGQERLFADTLHSQFPPASNRELHARHLASPAADAGTGQEADLAFVHEVRQRLLEAQSLPEGGWTLAPAGAPGAAR
jgi:hypothetical protein